MLSEQSSAYDPEELSLLGDIFDRTVASLPATMRTPFNRTEIAKNILTRAAAGERNRIELELAALDNLKVARRIGPSGEQGEDGAWPRPGVCGSGKATWINT